MPRLLGNTGDEAEVLSVDAVRRFNQDQIDANIHILTEEKLRRIKVVVRDLFHAKISNMTTDGARRLPSLDLSIYRVQFYR